MFGIKELEDFVKRVDSRLEATVQSASYRLKKLEYQVVGAATLQSVKGLSATIDAWRKHFEGYNAKQDKEIADLKATVQALREAFNEVMAVDVSKRYEVTGRGIGVWYSIFNEPAPPKVDTPFVARLVKTSPKAEPIPVTPAKPVRKRTK